MSLSQTGIERFLDSFCREPARLRPFMDLEPRLDTVRGGEALCHRGDRADCVWIVETGEFCISYDQVVTKRGPGEIIGESAFFRTGPDAGRRGADVIARGRSQAWKIDRAMLDNLSLEDRVLWTETVCQALVVKLDQATAQRASLNGDLDAHDALVRRFVCRDGVQAARAAMRTSAKHIEPARKPALIWFSDVANFSKQAEDLTPEEVGELLRDLLDRQGAEIARADGQIDKHIGDGLMAFWLCPDEDRIRRHVRAGTQAALAAARAVQEAVSARGLRLGLRIGLHLGDVAVGDFGSSDRISYTVVGEAVNRASRYEQYKAEAGQPDGAVRISDTVFKHLDDEMLAHFHAEPFDLPAKHDKCFPAHFSKF